MNVELQGAREIQQEPWSAGTSRSVCTVSPWLLNAGLAVCLKETGADVARWATWVLHAQGWAERARREDNKAFARGSVLGATAQGHTELGSSSSGQRVLHFTAVEKKIFLC